MADENTILRVAESERDHAAKAFQAHLREEHPDLPHEWCATCWSLDGHARRTQEQVNLLTVTVPPESEGLF